MHLLFVAAVTVLTGATAPAGPQPLPEGPYQATCRDLGATRVLLYGDCQTAAGTWVYSELRFRDCPGRIENRDGQLACTALGFAETSPHAPPEAEVPADLPREGLPPGPWKTECRNPERSGSFLVASCMTPTGRYRDAVLDLRRCGAGDVVNLDGELRCAAEAQQAQGFGGPEGLPPGPWRRLCRDPEWDGFILGADCPRPDGSWRYSEIDPNYCRGAVGTENGYLVCQ